MENAGIFLQTSSPDNSSYIKFSDEQHCISVKEGKLSIVSDNNELHYYGTNADRERVRQILTDSDATKQKRYFTQLYETVTENGVAKNLHYLYAPSGLFAIFATDNNANETMHYTITDHQGSLAACIDATTQDVAHLSYDAWGRRRNADGTYGNVSATFDRGYTGHEHLDEFGLINMNGRLYDPILGRMLSPDIVVQQADNTQSYNRYSYCLNNPLRFVDPSGWVVRGRSNYYDFGFLVDYCHVSTVSNGNAFNTELSEGIGSPVYDVNGHFLGTDDEGLQGEAIVMNKMDFRQGMRHEEALAFSTDLYENNREEAELRMAMHYANLPNRPDYDGYLTLDEANGWYRDGNGQPLFADLSKIDLSGIVSLGERFVGQEKTFNLLWNSGSLNDGLVYGSIKLKRYPNNSVRAYSDMYDFDMKSRNNPLNWGRNIETRIGHKVAGSGTPYEINLYGSKQLTPLVPWMK